MLRQLLVVAAVTALAGCGEKLSGTTWEGSYTGGHETKVAIEFVGADVAKRTIVEYSEPKTESLTYAFDGKLVKLTTLGQIVGTMTMDNGQLVSTPADIGIGGSNTAKIVLAKRTK